MVSSGIIKVVLDRWRSLVDGGGGKVDGLLWYKDHGRHVNGEFSMAVVQANKLLEDHCQVESGSLSCLDSGPYGTFVGVYDGHGGPETSRFINDHLFNHLKNFISEHRGMSVDVIYKAFSATEEDFLSLVKTQWLKKPQLASVGSCCLIGVVCEGILYVANVGDSRAVLGRLEEPNSEITAFQLSAEHNASIESVREELRTLHPDDSQIVVLKCNVWRVKGLIQVSRSIGDAYLKDAEFNREPLISRFRLVEPFHKPILIAEPTILVHKLHPHDNFLIFASDGLWDLLSNQEAVDIVHKSPHDVRFAYFKPLPGSFIGSNGGIYISRRFIISSRSKPCPNCVGGIAKRLVEAALHKAAKNREMSYSDLKKIEHGVRRHFHDDITVIVLFLDHDLIGKSSHSGPKLSIKGGPPAPVGF